ncbi:GyrI-like domain-containing protein, partial [uncultured Georgenia sp.]|uniref:GyrI-like domain-containing protein n=1 Tax=uncultured Georgenia sp. TaxID=378209 RepID=UPI00261CCB42
MVPDWLEDAMVEAAIREVGRTRRPERLDDVRLGTLTEGTCLQTLHVGPFDDEGPVLATLHQEVIPSRGLRPVGRHHEIYLSDFRRVPPANRRTILRQPVRPA